MYEMIPLFPGVPGGMELAVILLIAVLLFGANKIPKLARSTGEAMGEFKKGREEVEQELREMQESGEASTRETSTAPEPDIGGDTEPDIGANAETETDTETNTETTTE